MTRNALRSLIVAAVVAWLALPGVGSAALVAQWKLQDNAASTTVVATVGSDGTLTNAGDTSASTGTPGPGTALTRFITFDGTNDYVACTTGNGAVIQNKAVVSAGAWIKAAAGTGERTILFISNNAGSARFDLSLQSNGNLRAGGRAGDGESFQSKTTTAEYDDGTWHYVFAVINYATDAITIYVDGSSVSTTGAPAFTATATSNTASTDIRIGNRTASAASAMNGSIADVRIYDSDESANLAAIMAEKDISTPAWLSLNPCD